MRKWIALALFAALPLVAQPADEHTITVIGSGNVNLPPDRASFAVGVSTTRTSVREAFAENNDKTRKVIAALKAAGVKDNEIQTSLFTVESPYENGGRRTDRYEVSNTVTVLRDDPKGVGELLAAAIDAGANRVDYLHFFVADPAAPRDRALALAYRDARASAQKLAVAAGKTLGDPIVITTSEVPEPYRRGRAESITVTAAGPAVETGETVVSANVIVTFQLK